MSAWSSDSDDAVQRTPPPRRQLQEHPSNASSIPERKALRKRRKVVHHQYESGLAVLEGSTPIEKRAQSSEVPAEGDVGEVNQTEKGEAQHGSTVCGSPILKQAVQDPRDAFQEALKQLPAGFAEDFFLGHGHAKLNRSLAANAVSPLPLVSAITEEQRLLTALHKPALQSELFASWVRFLRDGFSLLVHGVGSKRCLLQEFADEALKPAGVVCVHLHAFDARFSLCECLRGLLEQIYPDAPRQGTSAEALGAAVRAAAAVAGTRPLSLIVHNLEHMPHQHMVVLSSLASSPNIHLVASIDSIWSPLTWDSRCIKDFNFCRQEATTPSGYEVESTARHPRGLPPWSGLGQDKRRTPKASLSLVLRSLTNNHRELVQAMADRQLERDCHAGISISALLKISTDLMIAASVPKLRSLLNELRDHEVVVQRGCSSVVTAQVLFYLPFDERTLERLSGGQALDSDDEAGEDAGAPALDEAREQELTGVVLD